MPEDKAKTNSPILRRLAANDNSAVKDCIEAYSGFIWITATKRTSKTEEAERLTLEIFNDIWKYAFIFNKTKSSDSFFINSVVRHRLILNYLKRQGRSVNKGFKDHNRR